MGWMTLDSFIYVYTGNNVWFIFNGIWQIFFMNIEKFMNNGYMQSILSRRSIRVAILVIE